MSLSETSNLLRTSPIFFLDFEASSLHPRSWPVEIGIARIDGRAIVSESCLIQPHDSWNRALWAADSEAIHGLPLDRLETEGVPANEAAGWFAKRNVGIGITDAPEFDRRWLARLLSVAPPVPTVQLLDFDSYVAMTVPDARVDRVYSYLDAFPAPHRAGADAARLAAAVLDGTDHSQMTQKED